MNSSNIWQWSATKTSEAVKKQKIARELKNLDMGFGTSPLAPQQISRIMDLLYKYKLVN